MRNSEFVRRKASGIAGQGKEALALLNELVIEGRVSYVAVAEIAELLHEIREHALQIEAKL
jgi:hypothetical protein